MLYLVLIAIIAVVWLIAFTGTFSEDRDVKGFALGLLITATLIGGGLTIGMSVSQVKEGHVGIPVSFGQALDPVGPGIDWHAPWVSVKKMNTQTQIMDFSGEDRIEAQVDNGGSLDFDMRVQYEVEEAAADVLYVEVGSEFRQRVLRPAARDCPRDITPSFSAESAYTDGRQAMSDAIAECIRDEVGPFGILVTDVFIGEVKPDQRVVDELNTREVTTQQIETANQRVQLANVQLREQEVAARNEAVRAFGVSQAEQIIACGGTPDFDEDLNIVDVTPNEDCEDQFSDEYLTWLFLQTIENGDVSLTLVAPELDAQLLLPTRDVVASN